MSPVLRMCLAVSFPLLEYWLGRYLMLLGRLSLGPTWFDVCTPDTASGQLLALRPLHHRTYIYYSVYDLTLQLYLSLLIFRV